MPGGDSLRVFLGETHLKQVDANSTSGQNRCFYPLPQATSIHPELQPSEKNSDFARTCSSVLPVCLLTLSPLQSSACRGRSRPHAASSRMTSLILWFSQEGRQGWEPDCREFGMISLEAWMELLGNREPLNTFEQGVMY